MSLPAISEADLKAKINEYISADGLANLTVGSVRKRLNEAFTLTPEQQTGLKVLCAELVQAAAAPPAPAPAKPAKSSSKPEKKRKKEAEPESEESADDSDVGSAGSDDGSSSGSESDNEQEPDEADADEETAGIGKPSADGATEEDKQLAMLRSIHRQAKLGINTLKGLKDLTKEEQLSQLSTRLKDAGIVFTGVVPTPEELEGSVASSVRKLLEKKELAEALEGIDTSNIIEGGRRARRSTAPAPVPAPAVKKSKPEPSKPSKKAADSDSEEAEF